jgi:hypothetical protein
MLSLSLNRSVHFERERYAGLGCQDREQHGCCARRPTRMYSRAGPDKPDRHTSLWQLATIIVIRTLLRRASLNPPLAGPECRDAFQKRRKQGCFRVTYMDVGNAGACMEHAQSASTDGFTAFLESVSALRPSRTTSATTVLERVTNQLKIVNLALLRHNRHHCRLFTRG